MKLALALSAAFAPLALAGNGNGLVMGLIRSHMKSELGMEMCIRSVKTSNEVVSFHQDPVNMAECDENDPEQMWAFDRVTGGIWSVSNGKRIDNSRGIAAINNPIQLWPRRRTNENKHDGSEYNNMRWTYEPDSQVITWQTEPSLCLDWNFAEGNMRSLRLYMIHKGENQRWDFVKVMMVDAEPFQIVSRDRSKGVMCVTAQGRHDGRALTVQPCVDDNPLQMWSRNANSGAIWINEKQGGWQLFDVRMGNTKIGTPVQTWGSRADPHTNGNGNRNMWFDYCPLTAQIRWRANNDRVVVWNQQNNELEVGASWDLPSAVSRLNSNQQWDFVHHDPASLIAPEPTEG